MAAPADEAEVESAAIVERLTADGLHVDLLALAVLPSEDEEHRTGFVRDTKVEVGFSTVSESEQLSPVVFEVQPLLPDDLTFQFGHDCLCVALKPLRVSRDRRVEHVILRFH